MGFMAVLEKMDIDLNWLNGRLEAFARYRQENEEEYQELERSNKDHLIGFLGSVFATLKIEPKRSKQELYELMIKRPSELKAVGALQLLLGGGFASAVREDFAVFLDNIDLEEFITLFALLFDEEKDVRERFREFRKIVNDTYVKLYEEGQFSSRKTKKPTFPAALAAIFLAGCRPEKYCLYKATEYIQFVEGLGITTPSVVEERYALFVDISLFIKDYAEKEGYPIWDLVDVHNLMFMFSESEQTEEEREDLEDGSTLEFEQSVYEYIESQGFIFPPTVITDYLISLITKPFVILSGISGTGKTKLAQLVADYVTKEDQSRLAFVPVRPDWTDNSSLLGFYNTITERYEVTPLLELLLKARENPGQAYFVILDEMNLAKVEHYFSDFLSVLESRRVLANGKIKQEKISLHNHSGEVTYYDFEGKEREIPSKLGVPANVFFTGTVNVDETTYMFSPKVLDRANTIEFNQVYLEERSFEQVESLVLNDHLDLNELLVKATLPNLSHFKMLKEELAKYYRLLVEINSKLEKYNLHFGYRVANEIAAFMLNVQKYCQGNEEKLDLAFDLQINQKILPKFNGNIAKLQRPLEELGEMVAGAFLESERKIKRMLWQLEEQGFTSFIE